MKRMRIAAMLLVISILFSAVQGCGPSDGLKETFIPTDAVNSSQTVETEKSGAVTEETSAGEKNSSEAPEECESAGEIPAGPERDYSVRIPESPVKTDSASFCVIDDSEGVLIEKNMLDPMKPASTTKVLTALVVYEQLPLDREVTVTEEEVTDGITVMSSGVSPSLRAGETFTVRDLLCMLILSSANTAGNVLADAAAGSTAAFAEMMNDKCAELGLTHSHFSNAHGLDAEDHYSCAYDLAVIFRNAMSVPELSEILNMPEYTVPATEYAGERHMTAGHCMVSGEYVCGGIIGGKPGWTVGAQSTLVSGFSRAGKNFYICTMGSDEGLCYQDTDNLAAAVYADADETAFDPVPVTHDIRLKSEDSEGVVVSITVDNANVMSRTAWWNTEQGTSAAVLTDLGALQGENEVRLRFPGPGTYAVQFFGKNASGQEKGIMVHVLYAGAVPPEGITNAFDQSYVIDDKGLMRVGTAEMSFGVYMTDDNGAVRKNALIDNTYLSGADGQLLSGWVEMGDGKRYFQPDGRMAAGRIIIDGEVREFSEIGVLLQ